MNTIINATPMTNKLGINDKSAAQLPVQPAAVPDHLPMIFIWGQKGPTGRQLQDGSNLVAMYGSDTFDLRKKFATHQTVLSGVIAGAGNAQMIERIVPADAGPKANFLLSLEVLPVAIAVNTRDANGIYLRDEDGDLIPDGSTTTAGFRVRWLKTTVTSGGPATADSTSFGVATSAPGTLTDGETTSTVYPVLQYWAGYYGAAGNNEGLRLMAPLSTEDQPPNQAILGQALAFQYRLQAISRINSNATPTVANALDGSTSMDFVLKPGTIHPTANSELYLGDIFKKTYQSVGDPRRADVYAGIPNVHIYAANIATLQALFLAGEKTAMTTLDDSVGSDISETEDTANAFKFNIFTFRNVGGAQYRCIEQDTTTGSAIALGASTNLYCASGADGTMTDNAFNTAVAAKLAEYGDPLSDVQDMALNPISVFYDTGFQLDTKYAACNLLARRKDTAVVLSTYTEGVEMTASEEASVGISLRSRLALFPESTYFGTPVVRGVIMARYGTMLGVNYSKKLPLTLWLAGKAAAFMGAGNGVWNAARLFDKDPATKVENFTDLNVSFVPASQRIVDWTTGLNYPIAYSRDVMFYPALKTAYADDTSVLTSFFTMMGCVALQKVGEQVWREYTGSVRYTRAQLVQNVNQRVQDLTNGKFAGLFKIVPRAYISGGDEARGFSYTLPIEIYANNAQTVMTLSVEAYRMPEAS
jgi:hypothetical protein